MSERTGALTSWGIVLPRGKRGWQDLTDRQRVGIVIRACLQAGLLIVALGDLARRPSDEVRGGNKWPWVLTIAVNYLGIGPIVYLAGGRRPHAGRPRGQGARRVAPADHRSVSRPLGAGHRATQQQQAISEPRHTR